MKKAVAPALFLIAMVVAPALGCANYGCPPTPRRPPQKPFPYPGGRGKCPVDAVKLGACVDLLSGLAHVVIGDPIVHKCCPLIEGVAGLEAALCLCTAIRAKLLNLNVLLPLSLELIAACGKTIPPGFKCPPH